LATYEELRGLVDYSPLRHAVEVGCVAVAVDIFAETPPVAERVAWANAVLDSPVEQARKIIHYVLLLNEDETVGAIQSAATNKGIIKGNVETAVAAIYGAAPA